MRLVRPISERAEGASGPSVGRQPGGVAIGERAEGASGPSVGRQPGGVAIGERAEGASGSSVGRQPGGVAITVLALLFSQGACLTEFPGVTPDGAAGLGDGSALSDAGATDALNDHRPDALRPHPPPSTQPPDAAVPPRDAAAPPPPPPPPPDAGPVSPTAVGVSLSAAQDELLVPVVDARCSPGLVVLSWTSRNARRCSLKTGDTEVSTALRGDAVPVGSYRDDVDFQLRCESDDDWAAAAVSVHIRPALNPQATVNRPNSGALQAACATRHGQQAFPDAAVDVNPASAQQLCRCAGYATILTLAEHDSNEADNKVTCFDAPTRNSIATWSEPDGDWVHATARNGNHCIGRLVCIDPVPTCGDLY